MPIARDVTSADGAVVRRKPVVGDMHWDGKRWRRWDGRRFVHAAYAVHPARLEEQTKLHDQPELDESRRQRALSRAVEDQVVTNGATVVLDASSGVVLAYRRPVSHVLHAVLTLVTAGLWIVVWLAVAFGRGEDRALFEVDRWGNVWARPVARP